MSKEENVNPMESKFRLGDKVIVNDEVHTITEAWRENGVFWYEVKSSRGESGVFYEILLQTFKEYEAKMMSAYKDDILYIIDWIYKVLYKTNKTMQDDKTSNLEDLDIFEFDDDIKDLNYQMNCMKRESKKFIKEYYRIKGTIKEEYYAEEINKLSGDNNERTEI